MPPGALATSDWRRQLPNWLTTLRLLLAAVFLGMLSVWHLPAGPQRPDTLDLWLVAAAVVFVLAAGTDALDGHLARRWDAVSAFGRVMDPFADKLLVLGAFVLLAGPGFALGLPPARTQASGVEPWMAVVVLGRELLVTSIRGVLEGAGIPFPATASGKLKMILQSLCVPLVLVLLALWPPLPVELATPPAPGMAHWSAHAIRWTVYLTVAVTVWSGVPYVIRGWRALRPPSGATTP
ncbi:MAG TPA: CDP-alcohol phosphatidyltransferase family protein [Phycisphaerales bacterium]|nr:CDP-alcohol phosphatidyltransferase family protein [Phycisphaerales bacterium]